ncbi:hypothetical protein LCGC14_1527620 [marine sediment metagenome]|uniref:Uncharacterized protein n=1 Tax=marine sediment metagenome TaxID=412755 RepID=A0A0F9LXS2_9ZZZZ
MRNRDLKNKDLQFEIDKVRKLWHKQIAKCGNKNKWKNEARYWFEGSYLWTTLASKQKRFVEILIKEIENV